MEGSSLNSVTHDANIKLFTFKNSNSDTYFIDSCGYNDTNQKDNVNMANLCICLRDLKKVNLILIVLNGKERKID